MERHKTKKEYLKEMLEESRNIGNDNDLQKVLVDSGLLDTFHTREELIRYFEDELSEEEN